MTILADDRVRNGQRGPLGRGTVIRQLKLGLWRHVHPQQMTPLRTDEHPACGLTLNNGPVVGCYSPTAWLADLERLGQARSFVGSENDVCVSATLRVEQPFLDEANQFNGPGRQAFHCLLEIDRDPGVDWSGPHSLAESTE